MNKRSPILGYNHNFSHRGLVFHVQTEDSGVDNPHIFSHLFHGGVILSSRKLEYDAEADEEVVKSLMQAQHKAVLKDLRRGTFDEKINQYLGDTPGLLPPAGAEEGEASKKEEPSQEDTSSGEAAAGAGEAREPVDVAAVAAAEDAAPVEMLEGAATIRNTEEPVHEPSADVSGPRHDRADSDVSAAFRAISEEESISLLQDEPAGESPAEESPAPPAPQGGYSHVRGRDAGAGVVSKTLRDDLSSGSYSHVRPGRRGSAAPSRPAGADTTRERRRPAPGGSATASAGDPSTPPAKPGESQRIPPIPAKRAPGARASTPPPIPPEARGKRPASGRRKNTPPPIPADAGTRSGMKPVPPAARSGQPSGKRTRVSERSGGSQPPVVVSRPAVIVGAPPKVVGGAPKRSPARRTQPRLAREDSRRGLFGKDLISEKSLDEVILAYLSEDSEEKDS